MSVEKVFNLIDGSRNYAVKLLSKLVSIPTVNPPGENYFEFCDFLREEMKKLGLNVDVKRVPEKYVKRGYRSYPRYILIARLGKPSDKPVLHFNGHYDVVPAGTGWTETEAFKPKVVGDIIYGRGTTDMKGGIVSVVTTVKSVLEANLEFKGCIEISATPDEETGGEAGVKYMVGGGLVKPSYAVIAEPSGAYNVYFGHRGGVWLKVTIYGKQAHGSTPWRGINAFEKTVKVANALFRELPPKLRRKISKYETVDERGRSATANIGGVVSGGAKVNIVPGEVSFTIDRRLIPEERVEEAIDEIRKIIDEVKDEDPQLNYKLEVLGKINSCITPANSKIVRLFTRSIEKVLKKKARKTMCIGGLDMRYFVEGGIETVTYGPGEEGVAHMANEHIDIRSILNAGKVYASVISDLMGKV